MPARGPRSGAAALLAAAALLSAPLPVLAQSTRLPPMIDEMTARFSENEIGGMGCLAGMALGSATLVVLIGGPGATFVALQGPLLAAEVLHGSAALAFVLSSACFVGQATTPLVLLGWSTLAELVSPARRDPQPEAPAAEPPAAPPAAPLAQSQPR
jgi:hypothetical protein